MKKLIIGLLAVAVVFACGTASAQVKVWDDLSWWGQSGATPAPFKDPCPCRSGYWWWPTEPASNAGDGEAWGNRGVVYGMYTPKVAEPTPTPAPTPTPTPTKERAIPTFNHVLFDFDKSILKPKGKAEIGKAVAELKKFGKDTVLIEGHTCNVGSDSWNMGLGQRRADAVKKFMAESGIAAKRVSSKSLGETKPAVKNDTPANRKLNRRAIMKITLGK
jgi:OmpA-OmpF porin, OOP family